jgi:hypothetical protein
MPFTASIHNPRQWRERAEEARAVAESLSNPHARQHMLACAESYERLAVLAALGPLGANIKTGIPDKLPH